MRSIAQQGYAAVQMELQEELWHAGFDAWCSSLSGSPGC
jgi:hypothetical protein